MSIHNVCFYGEIKIIPEIIKNSLTTLEVLLSKLVNVNYKMYNTCQVFIILQMAEWLAL